MFDVIIGGDWARKHIHRDNVQTHTHTEKERKHCQDDFVPALVGSLGLLRAMYMINTLPSKQIREYLYCGVIIIGIASALKHLAIYVGTFASKRALTHTPISVQMRTGKLPHNYDYFIKHCRVGCYSGRRAEMEHGNVSTKLRVKERERVREKGPEE